MQFEWDPSKSSANKKKHKVSFDEALTVFYDQDAVLIGDPDHSGQEDRFVMIGMSRELRILVVCHCVHEAGDVIRIISARKANSRERQTYEMMG